MNVENEVKTTQQVLLENWGRGKARICSRCDEVFMTRTQLRIHIRNTHLIGRDAGEQRLPAVYDRRKEKRELNRSNAQARKEKRLATANQRRLVPH